ncbi:Plasmodium variant antigen protein Cir/Yir/Bir, putative, partial [Plasmodium chabaudi adami]
MSEELCGAINFADEKVVFDPGSQKYTFNDKIFEAYCSTTNEDGKKECDSNGLKLSSAFMGLIEYFKSIDNENSEDDKLTQYAILWFSYKISQNSNIKLLKDTMYDILKQNDWFGEHSESIENKKDTMGIHYLYLKNLYELLKGICNTITICNKNPSNISECQESGNKCAISYRSCLISFPWEEICNPYCRVLSNLKNDYDKIREKYKSYNLPELKPPEGLSDCNDECFKQNKRYKDMIDAQNHPIDDSKIGTSTKGSLPDSSVTTTNINNGNKLPYIAVPFILLPIILGISYK